MDAGRLHKLARTLRDIASAATADPGEPAVSPSLLAVVEDVASNGPTSIGEIVTRTGIAQSQVSNIVASLLEGDVLTRSADPDDRRRTVVALEPTTREQVLQPRGSRPIAAALGPHLPRPTKAEVRRVEKLLDELADVVLGPKK